MKPLVKRNLIGWSVFVIIMLLTTVYDNHQTWVLQQKINVKSYIPAPDYNRNPIFFSLEDGKWIYATPSGAKAVIQTKEPYRSTSDELDKYLKKKLPIYRKKTYWGEEWDTPDVMFDDEGDEDEGDPDAAIKK